jgi:hypothetical protein
MNRVVLSAVLLAFIGASVPAQAAEPEAATRETRARFEVAALPPLAGDTDWSLPPVHLGGPRRGALLPTLYVSYAALNAIDAYSTSKGLKRGAVEGNLLMRGIAGQTATMWVTKAGVTVGSIALAERLWRADRKKAAVATMLIANGMMGVVAARNASVLRQIR